jgi:hypothetical protein
MSTPSSWRDLLRDVISDPAELYRLAAAIGVHAVTLNRWAQGVSTAPRPQRLRQLVQVFPVHSQALLTELLQQEYGHFQDLSPSNGQEQIDYAFIQQVWEARATTPTHLQFWTLSGKILESALRQFDPLRMGMSITIAQLMPPSPHGSIRSLREVAGLGNPPWSPNLENRMRFLGAETLAGSVVSHGCAEFLDDLRVQTTALPICHEEYEVSAAACPIMYANRVAGCLLFSSTQPAQFRSEGRRTLIKDYAQLLAQVFPPDHFFELTQIQLWLMPPPQIQYRTLATFQQRVNALMKEAYTSSQDLTRSQIEQQVWQQIEEELFEISNPVD